MFETGTLLWALYVLLKPFAFNLLVSLVVLGLCYLYSRYPSDRGTAPGSGDFRKFLPGLAVSPVITLLLGAGYVGHQLRWDLTPDFLTLFDFWALKHHLVILGTFPWIGMIAGTLLIKRTGAAGWPELGLCLPKIKKRYVIALIVAGYSVDFISNICWYYISGGSDGSRINRLVIEALEALRLPWKVYYISWVTVLGPISEEIFFRGALFGALSGLLGVKGGLFLQAAMFSVMHFSVGEVVPIFITGCILAYIYHRSGSLIPSMVLHILVNTAALLLMQVPAARWL